jgi:hypothetical protein
MRISVPWTNTAAWSKFVSTGKWDDFLSTLKTRATNINIMMWKLASGVGEEDEKPPIKPGEPQEDDPIKPGEPQVRAICGVEIEITFDITQTCK